MDPFFFFNDTATTEIYTLSLHDALPILYPHGKQQPRRDEASCSEARVLRAHHGTHREEGSAVRDDSHAERCRSEEHTSELQSRQYLVCRLLLEKKKNTLYDHDSTQTYST